MTIEELTYKINGCAMKVQNTLGNGFREVIYQLCLAIELERIGVSFVREKEHNIFYEDIHFGFRRADFLIEDKVIVELKAIINLEDVHLAQAKNYVAAYNYPVGLLINFGAKSLKIKKILNYTDASSGESDSVKNFFSLLFANPVASQLGMGSPEFNKKYQEKNIKSCKSNNHINPDSDK